MIPETEEDIVFKFLHTADWHLGRTFPRFGENEQKLTRARLDVIDRILGTAQRHAVDAVLCAGDLFDEPNPGEAWWEGLANRFQRTKWNGRPVFLLPGNHDPLLPDSIWAAGNRFRRELPDWVHVVDRPDFEYAFPEHNAVLHAVPCRSVAGQRDPTLDIPKRAPGDERIRIGMVHGSTFDLPNCETNFPISENAAVERGLDYLAIGDTHGFRFIPSDRKVPPTIYPGAPEPTAFDEKDPGQVAVVFVNRHRRATVLAERVAQWTWEEQVVESIAELRALRDRPDLASRVLRLSVEMSLPEAEYVEAEALLEDLQGTVARHGRVGVLELDREGLRLDTSSLETTWTTWPDVLRAAARKLQKLEQQEETRLAAQRALVLLCGAARKAS